MTARAFITGITGQDGSYLADLLLAKGYEVFGLRRRSSADGLGAAAHLAGRVRFIEGDMLDAGSLERAVSIAAPSEVYNLAAQSHVRTSFDQPIYTLACTGGGAVQLLEIVRVCAPRARFLQASTSELFGGSPPPQDERTPFRPRSPYAVAKLAAFWSVVNYREGYDLFAANAICFNHESPRRGPAFVTRKITRGAARIALKKETTLALGNLDARRDIGHALDYVEGMWRILQHERPDDFILASGETHSVQEILDFVFSHYRLDWREHVHFDPALLRPTEVNELRGVADKAKRRLGWQPTYDWRRLLTEMIEADYAAERVPA